MAGFQPNTDIIPVPIQVYLDDAADKWAAGVSMGLNGTAPRAIEVTPNGELLIDGMGTLTEYSENAVPETHPAGRLGIGVRTDTLTVNTDADGRFARLTADKYGAQFTREAGGVLGNGATAVNDTAGGTQILAASLAWRRISLTNLGPNTAYLGTGTVTTANGFPLLSGESIPLATTSEVKGICAAGETADVRRLVETL